MVVVLYGVLPQAERRGERAATALHWAEHERAWANRPEWHPALGRMLWDLVLSTRAAGWSSLSAASQARLSEVRAKHGDACLVAFGVPSGDGPQAMS